MNAPVVIDLASRRQDRATRVDCPSCGPDRLCYAHRLDHLADRLREAIGGMPALLVAADDVERLVSDALEVIDGITSECLPARPRVGTPNNPNNPAARRTQ